MRLDGSGGGDAQQLQQADGDVRQRTAHSVELEALRQRVPRRQQRGHPGLDTRHKGQVVFVQDLVAGIPHGLQALARGDDVWQSVANFNVFFEALVLLVLRIVFVRHAPLVASKDGTGLQGAGDLAVACNAVWGVAGGFNGVGSVQGRIIEGQLHEIALDGLAHVSQAVLAVQLVAAHDLVFVQGDSGDANLEALKEAGDVAHRSANAAANVHHVAIRTQLQLRGQVILMTTDRFGKRLKLVLEAEVEAAAPAPFVKDSRQIVVCIDQLLVRGVAFSGVFGVQILVGGNAGINRLARRQIAFLEREKQRRNERRHTSFYSW